MPSRSTRKVIYAALLGNVLVAVTKFVAAGLTRSSAMTILLLAGSGVQGADRVSWPDSSANDWPALPFADREPSSHPTALQQPGTCHAGCRKGHP